MILICYMIFISLLYTSNVNCTRREQDPIASIRELRVAQKTASYSEYYRYDHEIQKIKQDNENSQGLRVSRIRQVLISFFHFLPRIIWQLFALLLALLLVVLPRRSVIAFIMLGIICILIGLSYGEHSQQWLIISEKKPLYLGPGTQYPVRTELNYLDEVCCQSQQGEWKHVIRNGVGGWIHNA